MTDPNRIAEIDPARTIHLDNGWVAAVCVNPNGDESLWLVSLTPDATAGCACPDCAPHEQLSPWAASNAFEATEPSR